MEINNVPTAQGLTQGPVADRWLDNNDVKEMLHISTRTLQTWRSCGILPYSKVLGKLFYKLSDVQALLNQSYTGASHNQMED